MATFTASIFIVLNLNFYHTFIANEWKLCMYIGGYSTDIHTCFHTVRVYRSLYRVGTPKKPDGDLTDIYCVIDSYYVKKIMEQIEKGGKYAYGDIPMRQSNCHKKAHIKLSKHLKMRKVATKLVHVSLPEQKVQKCYTGTTTANIIGAI